MQDMIKGIWVVLFVFSILGVLSMLPVDKYQKAYLKEFHRIKSEPQRRVEATYRYIEAIESGEEASSELSPEPPAKYYTDVTQHHNIQPPPPEPYKEPLYVRDKHNPNILHPYRRRR